MKLKLVSLFSGIGAFEKSLEKLKLNYEVVHYCEIDKYASRSYAAVHGEPAEKNLHDVTKIDTNSLSDFNMLTWGFPCQDISVAGKGRGIVAGQTRSGLYYEGLRILEAKKPEYSVVENVKNLVGKKFKPQFEQMLRDFDNAGYNSYWKVLNAKNYGIPQNRERVFIISIRKDVDPYTIDGYPWPEPFDSGLRLKDFLEPCVDEKYYIDKAKTKKLIDQIMADEKYREARLSIFGVCKDCLVFMCDAQKSSPIEPMPCLTPDKEKKRQMGRRLKSPGEPAFTVTSQDRHGIAIIDDTQGFDGIRFYFDEIPCQRAGRSGLKLLIEESVAEPGGSNVDTNRCKMLGMIDMKGNESIRRVYDASGVCPTISTCQGGHREPKIMAVKGDLFTRENPERQNGLHPEMFCLRTAVQHGTTETKLAFVDGIREKDWACDGEKLSRNHPQGGWVYNAEGIASRLIAQCVGGNGGCSGAYLILTLRIRKLTPRECWRLMGFKDEDFDRAVSDGISNNQLYKQAGNSIVVDVLEQMLAPLLKDFER